MTTLLTNQTYLTQSFDQNCQVDTIYTDFQKVFDKVNHSVLLHRLKAFCFNGSFLSWIASYLKNQSQSVKLSFQVSDAFHVLLDIPQE